MATRDRFQRQTPRDHPLRRLRVIADALLEDLETAGEEPPHSTELATAPLIRALLLQALFSIPNAAVLCEQVRNDGVFRRFVGSKTPTPLSPRLVRLGRARLFERGVAPSFFVRLFGSPQCARLLLDPVFRLDRLQLEAWTRHAATAHADTRPEAMGSILLLPRMSDAFTFLPYLEAHGTSTPLECVLRRLRLAVRGPIAVTAYSRATASAIDPIVRRCRAQVLTLDPCSQLTQLIEAASQLNVANVAVWEPGAALLPTASIRELCLHHRRTGNDLTIVSRLPEGVGGVLYQTACLHRMRAEAPQHLDVSPREWFECTRRNAADGEPLPFHSDGLRRELPESLPRQITVTTVDDWQRIAAAAVAASETSRSDWQPLLAWSRARVLPPRFARSIRKKTGGGPRILYVTPSRGFSGPERMYVRLATALLDRGVDLWGLMSRPGMIASLLQDRHRGRFIADNVEFDQPTQASLAYCVQVMEDVEPDLVHCNGIADWPVLTAANLLGVPLVEHVRVAEFAADEDSFDSAARLLAVSNFVRGELISAGVDPGRVVVCYDGIDRAFFERKGRAARALRRRLAIDDREPVIVCVARCSRSKRIETVIEAVGDATASRRRAHLVIVGEIEEPAYFEALRDLVWRRGLRETTHFLHAVEDMPSVFAAADALMLASVRDPLPNAILEAMASGTPVIAAASGGIPEMLDDMTGTLVAPDSVRGFARALKRVLDGSDEIGRQVRRARIVARRRFNLDDHAEAVRRIYHEVADGTR